LEAGKRAESIEKRVQAEKRQQTESAEEEGEKSKGVEKGVRWGVRCLQLKFIPCLVCLSGPISCIMFDMMYDALCMKYDLRCLMYDV
jgi:hypothetical protein